MRRVSEIIQNQIYSNQSSTLIAIRFKCWALYIAFRMQWILWMWIYLLRGKTVVNLNTIRHFGWHFSSFLFFFCSVWFPVCLRCLVRYFGGISQRIYLSPWHLVRRTNQTNKQTKSARVAHPAVSRQFDIFCVFRAATASKPKGQIHEQKQEQRFQIAANWTNCDYY